MDQKKLERFKAFLTALEASGQETGGGEIACHHSAVEVNDWSVIREEMLKASKDQFDTKIIPPHSDG